MIGLVGSGSVSHSILAVIRKSWAILTRQEQRRVVFLGALMTANAVVQSASLVMILPFVSLFIDQESADQIAFMPELRGVLDRLDPGLAIEYALGAALAVLVVLKAVFEFQYNRSLNKLIAAIEVRRATALLRACIVAPYPWFIEKSTSYIVAAIMTHNAEWARVGLKGVLNLISGTLLISFVLAMLVLASPWAGLSTLVVLGFLFLVVVRSMKSIVNRLSARKRVSHDNTLQSLLHVVSGIKDIKINGRERYFVEIFERWQARWSFTNANLATVQPMPNLVLEVAITAGFVGTVLVFHAMTLNQANLFATLAVYAIAVVRLVPVLNRMSSTIMSIQSIVPLIDGVTAMTEELAGYSRKLVQIEGTPRHFKDWQEIRFDRVAYRYATARRDSVEDLSVSIGRAERIGIVGMSGAGKTTFVDLMAGLLPASEGHVSVDSEILDLDSAPDWMREISYVQQSHFITDGSLRFNIVMESDTERIDEARLERAIDLANLRDLVEHGLAEGLDSLLGEGGIRLSGGQRQRVSIARALYREPTLLILDEATSALDVENEARLSETLATLPRDVCIVLIAHRISTIKECDRILVFDAGRIVAEGDHRSLLESNPQYRRFVELADVSAA